ncbi:MAG: ABC transporter permease subunit, partial [Clostridia bacterium]|nr:ABC transporter permease subunit [Clostridia bacterium]
AQIDGAGKWKQMLNVTLPGIAPTIIIMLLLKIGNILNIGYEKIILLYNPLTYDTADVLQSFIYRRGLQEFDWGYSTAAGMFNSVINTILLISANKISNKVSETALW